MSRALVIACAADALTLLTFYALYGGHSIQAERNPLVLLIVGFVGFQGFALVKIGLAAIVGWRHDHATGPLSPRYLRARSILMSLAIASATVGALFNTAAIVSGL